MFIITGANGFIGHNLYKKIKKKYNEKILVIDDLDKIQKSKKIQEETIDFRDFDKFNLHQKDVKAIFHLGAITDTTFNNFDIIDFKIHNFPKNYMILLVIIIIIVILYMHHQHQFMENKLILMKFQEMKFQ